MAAALLLFYFAIPTRGLLRAGQEGATHQAAASADLEALAGSQLRSAKCDSSVSQDDLELGLRIGTSFLVNSQRKGGNFRYEYNWLSQAESEDDNPVRQAGTLWSLALLHADDRKSGLLPIVRKGLQYFEKHSVEYPGGLRLVNYPGQDPQKLGTVALLALTHIEALRRPETLESDEEKRRLEDHLAGYLRAIVAARTGQNSFYKYYRGSDGKPVEGPSSPYYDGECLLALVKAAKYLGHTHLWDTIKAASEAGWRKNVLLGLQIEEAKSKKEPAATKGELSQKQQDDALKRLKGYYQWASMAWYELLGTEDPNFAKYAQRMLRYGDWMVQKAPSRTANTGFAYEGLIPAFVTAVRQGDEKREKKLACAIREGMQNLHSLQVGHPRAYRLAEPLAKAGDSEKGKDQRAQGGAQGSRASPALRIDTTQHQMHALLMARRLLEQQALL